MNKSYDVIVVGAGPAGCSAACFIAHKGYEVLLIDKAKFPRDKICGDGFSASSLAVLEKLGALEIVERSNPFRIDKVTVSSPNGTIVSAKPPTVEGLRDYGYVIPRKEFDYQFLQFAEGISKVTLLENIRVEELIYDGLDVCGVRSKNEMFIGKIIIGADGVHSTIAKILSLRNNNPKHRGLAMRAYFDNVENLNHEIEIHYEESILPGYAWIFPTGEHTANVGVGVLTRFADPTGIRDLFYRFLERNNQARIKLTNAQMIENSLRGCPLPIGSFPSERSYRNVLLIGDAASFVDSLTGEGIYYALRSGEYAAEAVDSTISRSNRMERVGAIYEGLWKKEFKWKEFYTGYLLQSILNNTYLTNFAVNRASKSTKKAETLAGVIAHKLPKRKLFYNI
jgi:geranylgeranyl reductase family protein